MPTPTLSATDEAIQNPQSKTQNWDALIAPAGASLLQSSRWGEFKRPSGWTPLRLASNHAIDKSYTIASQVLVRSVPRLPFRVSVAYIPRGPVYLSTEVTQDDEAAFESSAAEGHASFGHRGPTPRAK